MHPWRELNCHEIMTFFICCTCCWIVFLFIQHIHVEKYKSEYELVTFYSCVELPVNVIISTHTQIGRYLYGTWEYQNKTWQECSLLWKICSCTFILGNVSMDTNISFVYGYPQINYVCLNHPISTSIVCYFALKGHIKSLYCLYNNTTANRPPTTNIFEPYFKFGLVIKIVILGGAVEKLLLFRLIHFHSTTITKWKGHFYNTSWS